MHSFAVCPTRKHQTQSSKLFKDMQRLYCSPGCSCITKKLHEQLNNHFISFYIILIVWRTTSSMTSDTPNLETYSWTDLYTECVLQTLRSYQIILNLRFTPGLMLNRASSTASISSTPLPLKAAWKSFSACSSFIELNGGRPFWLPDMRVFRRFPGVWPWLHSVALLATNLGPTILDKLKDLNK